MDALEIAFGILKPSNAIYLVAVAGFVLLLWRRRLGTGVLGCAIVLWGAVAYLPVGRILAAPLEARVPQAAIADIDGIVLLGGFLGHEAADSVFTGLGPAGERLLATALLAHRFPQAEVVITDVSEALAAAGLLKGLGVAPERIKLETRARSTWDNARFALQVTQPQAGSSYALVTSAWHMPRALGVFRTAGWPRMVPVPVDRMSAAGSPWSDLPLSADTGFAETDLALREWLALLAYRLAGRTDEFLPSPPGVPGE